MGPRGRALLLGWRGGVGTALLHLLARHPAGRRIAGRLGALYLLDVEEAGPPPPLAGVEILRAPPGRDPEALAPVLAEHRIDQVIEVADVDTLGLSAVCARYGADYVSASMLADVPGDDGLTMVAARRLLPEHRPDVGDASHLIGSGMNPGVVNALVLAGLDELAARVGAPPSASALDVYGLYVTEEDATGPTDAAAAAIPDGAFPMSWSPEHALEEILEPHAMLVARGRLARLDHRPHDRAYRVRCGDREIDAMVVPHEEVVTLGRRFPSVESAFFYRVAPLARDALARHPDRAAADWPIHRLYPPHEDRLAGRDRVGALIASRRHGELWLGFDTAVEDGLALGTNATLLQTAAGVLAGWSMLGARRGIHVVEELDWRAYLGVVEEVLGPREVHHAIGAPARTIAQRRIDDAAAHARPRLASRR